MKKVVEFVVNKRYPVMIVMLLLGVVCAILMPQVKINTDMTKYLPDDSSMKMGLEVMEQEFPETELMQTIRVMFQDLNESQKEEILAQLKEISYVDSVDYQAGSQDYNKDNHTLFVINTAYDYGSPEERSIEGTLQENFSEYDMTFKNDNTSTTDIPLWILCLAVLILMVVLFIMCGSWMEPFLFLAVIGLAILINLGTNLFLGNVSNITFSMAAILQLVLSMDYSIILMNRYRQELQKESDRSKAMQTALLNAFSSIISSSVTTIVGLLALVFMSFKIGLDLGVVLAKGVFISMLCIFTVLPGLILLFDKLIQKTAKKELGIRMNGIARFSYRFRHVFAVGFILLFAGACILQTNTKTAYTLEMNDPIAEIFPTANTVMMLYDNNDEDQVTKIAQELEKYPQVKTAANYSNTLGKPYTSSELSEAVSSMGNEFSLDPTMLNLLYYDYFQDGKLPSISLSDFIQFIVADVVSNDTFATYLDEDIKSSVTQMQKFSDPAVLTQPMGLPELSEFFGLDQDQVKQLLVYYYSQYGGTETGVLTLPEFASFLTDEIAVHPEYASMLDADISAQIETLSIFSDAEKMTRPISYQETAQLLGLDENTAKLLYVYYYALSDDYDPGNMRFAEFIQFLRSDVAQDPIFSAYLDQSTLAQLEALSVYTDKNLLQKQMSSQELAQMMGLDPAMIEQVFTLSFGSGALEGKSMTLAQFTGFLVDSVLVNDAYADYFDAAAKAQIIAMNQIVRASAAGQAFTPAELSQISGLDATLVQQLFQMYSNGQSGETMTLPEFFEFLVQTVLPNESFSAYFDEAARAQIVTMNQLVSAAASGEQFTSVQLAQILGIEEAMANQIFLMYFGSPGEKTMSIEQFVDFLLYDVIPKESFSAFFDESTIQQLTMMQGIIKAVLSDRSYSYSQIAQLLGLESFAAKMLYTYRASSAEAGSWRLSIQTIVDFLMSNSSQLDSLLGSDQVFMLETAQKLIYGSIRGTSYSSHELASLLGMDSAQTDQLFLLYVSEHGDTSSWKMSAQEFLRFLSSDVLSNDTFAEELPDGAASQLILAKAIVDGVVSGKEYTADEVSQLLSGFSSQMDKNTTELLYLYYGSLKNSDPNWRLSIQTLFNFLSSDIVNDSRFAGVLDKALLNEIDEMQVQIDEGLQQLKGANYSRLILTTTFPSESEETTAFFDEITAVCSEKLQGDYYLIGNSAMNYEMEQNFGREMFLITLLTAIAIFIVVALTFRSLVIPAILVLIVQCGVYITVTAIGLQGYSIYYLALLIVQCILMGATIDYGILFTNYYREKRQAVDAKSALTAAYNSSIHTILTSASIMVFVTAIIGYCFTDPTIGQICRTIAIGAFSATVLILFVLPSILATFDRFVINKKERKKRQK